MRAYLNFSTVALDFWLTNLTFNRCLDINVHVKYCEDWTGDGQTDGNPSSDSITNSFIELTDPINLVFDTKITFLSATVLEI